MYPKARYTARLAANQKAYHTQFYNGNDGTDSYGNGGGDGDGGSGPVKRCCYDSGSQTSNVMALHINAAPTPEIVNSTVAMLVTSIYDHTAFKPGGAASGGDTAMPPTSAPAWGAGPHLDVGITGTTFIFETLHAHAHDSVIFELLNLTTFPSLGHMISQDATTLWEAWDGDKGSMCESGSSRNHIMFGGGVNRFLHAAVGGLTVDTRPGVGLSHAAGNHSSPGTAGSNGWQRLLVHPSPAAIRALAQGGAERKTVRGLAKVSWTSGERAVGDALAADADAASAPQHTLEMNVTVPLGSVASVKLPLAIAKTVDAVTAATTAAAATVVVGGGESGGCVLSCSDMALVGTAPCMGVAAAACSHRRDGEPIMSLTVVRGGKYTFTVML